MLPIPESACDPVGLWLKARPDGGQRGYWHSMRFTFAGTPVLVRSRCADVISFLRREIGAYYPDSASVTDHRKRCRVEISVVNGRQDQGIVVAIGEGASMKQALNLPPPCATISTAEFVHMRWNELETFWRPFDLLASVRFSTTTDVRLLVAMEAPRRDKPAARTRRLRTKVDTVRTSAGGVGVKADMPGRRYVPLAEIADLVRVMTVRAQGHFCLHAATVALGDRGILLAGPSGCGKTTTALSLSRGGYELLGDEHSVLNASEERIRVTGFNSAPRVVGKALRTLARLELTLQSAGEGKNPITLPKASFLRQNPWLRPALMLFLRIGPDVSEHLVSPLSMEEAFVRVTGQVLDPTNVFRKAEQTQAIIKLIEQCPAYELVLGKNLASLPELVRSLMEPSL